MDETALLFNLHNIFYIYVCSNTYCNLIFVNVSFLFHRKKISFKLLTKYINIFKKKSLLISSHFD